MAPLETVKGYQGLQTKLVQINSPFGSDAIRESIYCSYPDKTNYLIAIQTLPQNQTRIIVLDFKLNDTHSDSIQVDLPIIAEYDLWKEGNTLQYLSHIFPLKMEKCFLAVVFCTERTELWKIEIESGNILWKKITKTQAFVEDDRGILFSLSYEGFFTVMDSGGVVLDERKTRNEGFKYGIGLDMNDNLLVGGYGRKYLMEIRVISKNGKFVKKLDGLYSDFLCQVDPFKKLTYIVQRNDYFMHSCDTDYDVSRFSRFEHPILGFFFVKDCKYLVICDEHNVHVYN